MSSYECDQCGACCCKLIIGIEPEDIAREPKLIALAAKHGPRPNPESQFLLTCCNPCPMLGADDRCTIYETRPDVCRGFVPGCDQCQDARERSGLSPLAPLGATA